MHTQLDKTCSLLPSVALFPAVLCLGVPFSGSPLSRCVSACTKKLSPLSKKPYKPDFKHSYTRRCHGHDYRAPFIYHIILSKAEECDNFGSVKGDAKITPGLPGCAYVERSPLGDIIQKALKELPKEFPIIQMYQYCVMPDHVHILLRVLERSEMHLGFYITKLKGKIREEYGQFMGRDLTSEEIFKPNYCDKPLTRRRSLDALFRYIRQNPHRLAMRHQYPQFFQRVRKLKIGDHEYEAYGNLFLFRNPDMAAVKISRSFSAEEKVKKKANWLSEAAQGTVLVSPFISKDEKAIRYEAETNSASLILITHETFPERFKPAAHDFELCSAGRLLIISLGEPKGSDLTRDLCQRMNTLAEEIAKL